VKILQFELQTYRLWIFTLKSSFLFPLKKKE
jgi:hypothetical protein